MASNRHRKGNDYDNLPRVPSLDEQVQRAELAEATSALRRANDMLSQTLTKQGVDLEKIATAKQERENERRKAEKAQKPTGSKPRIKCDNPFCPHEKNNTLSTVPPPN